MNDLLAAARFDWARAQLAAESIRPTAARLKVLRQLAGHGLPQTYETISSAPEVAGFCDRATVWRALAMPERHQIVRHSRLAGRHSYYSINLPGQSENRLICRVCGAIDLVPGPALAGERECRLAGQAGFQISYCELNVYGVCVHCARQGGTLAEPISQPAAMVAGEPETTETKKNTINT